jgi:N-acetylneuraminic acid mutarotase
MMLRLLSLLFSFLCLLSSPAAGPGDESVALEWSQLPTIPNTPGIASPYVGTSGDVLLVAGGANFPDAPPWRNGTKVWHDDVYAFIDQQWRIVGKLPKPMAYGVSFQTSRGVLCVGGSDAQSHLTDVFLMRFVEGQIEFESLPDLPLPIANASGARTGSTVYVAGGTESPGSTQASSSFYSLDLSAEKPQWKKLPDVPGPGRMLSVAATNEKSIFVFSGASLAPGNDGKPVRSYLRDSWQFDIARSAWKRQTDLPFAAVAAPSPAAVTKSGKIVVLGGDDGSHVGFKPPEQHPGFTKTALVYDPAADRWTSEIPLNISRVTVPLAAVSDGFILASGEVRPGIRSPEVWRLRIDEQK